MQKRKVFFTSSMCGALLLFFLLIISDAALSQDVEDSSKSIRHFGGAVTATNNGVSLLPTFSLGKPAVIFDMNVGNKKLSFEPQLRFAMGGKPWAFIFWWRYKLLKTDKFQIGVGAHPSFVFRTVPITNNGITNETLVAQRYLATEFAPNYFITKSISVGIYYLYSHGFEWGAVHNTNFITINSNLSNIKLTEQYFLKFNPQVFYLWMDGKDGYYVTTTVTFARRDFPLSLQSIINQAIKTNIPTKSDFVWNLSLIYSFRKEYVAK